MTQLESYESEMARERFRLSRSVVKPVLRASLVSRLGAVPRAAPSPRHLPRRARRAADRRPSGAA